MMKRFHLPLIMRENTHSRPSSDSFCTAHHIERFLDTLVHNNFIEQVGSFSLFFLCRGSVQESELLKAGHVCYFQVSESSQFLCSFTFFNLSYINTLNTIFKKWAIHTNGTFSHM